MRLHGVNLNIPRTAIGECGGYICDLEVHIHNIETGHLLVEPFALSFSYVPQSQHLVGLTNIDVALYGRGKEAGSSLIFSGR
jgi:hypothetical protein